MSTRVASRASSRGRTAEGKPNPVDVHVGDRVRQRRMLCGLSQEQFGHRLGLTFQQVQKYEKGANRISASRLFDIANILDVPVSFFFDDMDDDTRAASPASQRAGTAPTIHVGTDTDPLTKRETLELVRAYYRIDDAQVRQRVYDLAKALGGGTAAEAGRV